MMHTKKYGFVIPLTLMLIAIAMVIITAMYRSGSLFVPFSATMIKREQAKLLALSGIQVGMAQLASFGEVPEKKEGTAATMLRTGFASAGDSAPKQFLSELLPVLNQWQQFKLTKSTDGVDGEISIAIASEAGKINLNAIYDFAKRKFRGENEPRGDWKKIMQTLMARVQKKMGGTQNMFGTFENFMKGRQHKLNDATELITLDAFGAFAGKEFYRHPPTAEEVKQDLSLYLLDLFTVYGRGPTIQPWLFSNSVRDLLDMKRSGATDMKQRKTMVQSWMKNFKPTIHGAQEWNKIFQPVYGIEFQRLLKGIDAVFESSFDPTLFSVVSYGIIGGVMQRAYAIVERFKRVDKKKTWYDVKIKKFYWI